MRSVTRLPEIPIPMVPPKVLLNCCEAVAIPRSSGDRLFCTIRSVEIDINPIPRPATAKTTEHAANDVVMENVRVKLHPANSNTAPSNAAGRSFSK